MALLCGSPGVAPRGLAARREDEGLREYPRHVGLHGPDSKTDENPRRAEVKGQGPLRECFLRFIFTLATTIPLALRESLTLRTMVHRVDLKICAAPGF
jgi:hypothetical protein